MNEGLKRFEMLMVTDEDFRKKLQEAAEKYTGEPSSEAVFSGLLVPFAAEYGITASYDEFIEYIKGREDQELNAAEVAQVAGGVKTSGGGACAGSGAAF